VIPSKNSDDSTHRDMRKKTLMLEFGSVIELIMELNDLNYVTMTNIVSNIVSSVCGAFIMCFVWY
jgi:hypothetical protein